MVLLNHVLQVILVFYLMALTLNKGDSSDLEQLCREFLWGRGESGVPKIPLVAWSTSSQPLANGGLGILSFRKQAQLLKMRCATQLIEGDQTAWVRMAEDLICVDLTCGPFKRERRHWSPSEALLLKVKIHMNSKMINIIINSWEGVLENLHFDAQLDLLLARLSIHQLLSLVEREGNLSDQQQCSIIAYCRVRGLGSAGDFLGAA